MSVSANPNYGIVAAATGKLLLDLNNNSFTAVENNRQSTTGLLYIRADGEITWTGDTLGVNESGMTWWSPIGSTNGVGKYARLVFISGTQQTTVTEFGLNTWYEIGDDLIPEPNWFFTQSASNSNSGKVTVGNYRLDIGTDGATASQQASFSVTLLENTI